MTTAALWQRYLAHGDEDSFAGVFDAEKDVVWTICVRYLGHGEDAEEAFQSAWARLITEARAAKFTADAAQDHLCRTAGREADALRKRRARRNARETTMPTPPESIDTGRSPVASLGEAERRAAIEALVAQLPDKLRLPVQLHYLNGMSQRQVAATLGVPRSTIDSRLRVALDRLRPLAERAGLRDALPVLAGGGMSAGLLATPASLTAASVLAGGAASTSMAGGVLSGTTAKIVAACAVVVLVAGVGIGLMRPATPETIALDAASIAQVADAEEMHEQALVMASAAEPEAVEPGVPDADTAPLVPALLTTEAEPEETASESEKAELAEAAMRATETETEQEERDDPEARFLSILLVDALDDALIANAEVHVWRGGYKRTLTTNSDGVAHFDDIPLGSAIIDANADGYAQSTLTLNVASTDPVVTVKLDPGSTLYGVVQDEEGTPISGVRILVSNSQLPSAMESTSDAEGRYEVNNVARGIPLYQVYAEHPGYKPNVQIQKIVVPIESERFKHDITLESQVSSLSGVVVDHVTGDPLPNVRLRGTIQLVDEPLGHTNDEGRFTIKEFSASNNRILFSVDGYQPKAIYLEELTEPWIEVGLERASNTSGIVVDEDQQILPDIRITVWSESYHIIATGRTGADGTYSFDNLDSGAILWVLPPGQQRSIRFDGLAGKTNQRIVVPRYSPVTGRVVDATNDEPIEQFRVRLGFPKYSEPGDERLRGISTTDMDPGVLFDAADGIFQIGSFTSRVALSVIVDAEGYAPTEIGRVVVDPESEPVTIRLNQVGD